MIEKFLILIMSIFLILAAGSANIYPIYLQNLIEKFGFTINVMNLYGSIVTDELAVPVTRGILSK